MVSYSDSVVTCLLDSVAHLQLYLPATTHQMAVAEYHRAPVPDGLLVKPWIRNIRTGVAAMTTTGGHLWNASERLVGAASSCGPVLLLVQESDET